MPDEIADAATRLRAVVRTLNRRAQADTGQDSPTRSQQAALAWLEDRGPLTPGQLAALERIRPQSIGQTVDALAKRGWIKRAPHPDDRRQIVLSLTPAGTAAVRRGRTIRQAWLTEAMTTRLNSEERRTLAAAIGLLERIVND